jgi:N-acetylmuramoyl-L-alanine amidase
MDILQKMILPLAVVLLLARLMNQKIINITDQLPRGNKAYPKRNLQQIVRFVIHHSADPNGTPEKYAKYHVKTHGWPGIGYHFVIQKDGTIYQTNALETISYNVENYNTGTVGICLTGNFEDELLQAAQKNSLIFLLKKLVEQLGPKSILPHSAFKATACPGEHIDTDEISQLVYGLVA